MLRAARVVRTRWSKGGPYNVNIGAGDGSVLWKQEWDPAVFHFCICTVGRDKSGTKRRGRNGHRSASEGSCWGAGRTRPVLPSSHHGDTWLRGGAEAQVLAARLGEIA